MRSKGERHLEGLWLFSYLLRTYLHPYERDPQVISRNPQGISIFSIIFYSLCFSSCVSSRWGAVTRILLFGRISLQLTVYRTEHLNLCVILNLHCSYRESETLCITALTVLAKKSDKQASKQASKQAKKQIALQNEVAKMSKKKSIYLSF